MWTLEELDVEQAQKLEIRKGLVVKGDEKGPQKTCKMICICIYIRIINL
jgi:hypothetical protein